VSVTQAASCAAYLPEDGAVAAVTNGGIRQWKVSDYIAADQANSLRWLVWAKTKDAQHGRNKPKMIEPPVHRQANVPKDTVSLSTDEVAQILKRIT
jgi:hypothetical protein